MRVGVVALEHVGGNRFRGGGEEIRGEGDAEVVSLALGGGKGTKGRDG